MDLGLKDQVVFITGASRGIGRATAELLVGEGCRVAITGRDEETLRRAVDELGGDEQVLGIQGDMTRNEDIERAVDATIERFGQVDVLVDVRRVVARRAAREPHRGGVVRRHRVLG